MVSNYVSPTFQITIKRLYNFANYISKMKTSLMLFKCKDVYENHCKFVVGKGKGGITKRLKIGKTDTDTECAQLVRNLEPSANGATWRRGNRNCYAEFGATTQDDNHKYQTCLFKGKLIRIHRKSKIYPFIYIYYSSPCLHIS